MACSACKGVSPMSTTSRPVTSISTSSYGGVSSYGGYSGTGRIGVATSIASCGSTASVRPIGSYGVGGR